ncbi:MAG TPA: hypothetical protein VFN76_10770 [Candidatus Limnocylindria bacterium]|nr:hypothetical protein [Candidatus Limnocylindria bacterium]
MVSAVRGPLIALIIVGLAAMTAFLILMSPPTQHGGTVPDATISAAPIASGGASPSLPGDAPGGPSAAPVFLRYEVGLQPGEYTLFEIDASGTVTGERSIDFDRPSMAPVDRVQATNGLIHWRTVVGTNAGWSYVPGRSGSFLIREVVRWPDGHTENRPIDPQG